MCASWRCHCWLLEITSAPQGALSLENALTPLLLGISGAIAFSGSPVLAQITPDATLGTGGSIVTPNVNIRGLPANRIDGGAMRGANLFHSFSEFNVGEASRVYFANPAGIENILTRVTGNNLSNIVGTLGVDGGASLFLLNPNGILFGSNAKLDIAGSFVASTANSVVFENGFVFSTTNPQAPPLLTVKVPLGLQYGSHQSGTITNAGNLAVGQDLTLSAGTLDLQGQLHAGRNLSLQAQDTVRVRDSAANPFIASARGQLVVQGDRAVDIFALNHPESGFYSVGDMVLRSANTVGGDAHYFSGGNFQIQQLDGKLGNLSSPNDPIIRSLGDVSFDSYIGTSLHILAGGKVTIGLVGITGPEIGTAGIDYIAENITLSDGTVVPINGRIRPTLDVRAGVDPAQIGSPLGLTGNNFLVDFFNFSLLGSPTISNTATGADISIGAIAMLGSNAADGVVLLTNQYKPNLSLPVGNIEVGAIVTTDNVSQVANQLPADLRNLLDSFGLLDGFTGNGGDVILDSRGKITLNGSGLANFGLNFGLINTSSGTGNAGDITLLARDTVSVANSFIFSDSSGTGKGGDITVKATSVSFTDKTLVSASTFGTGQGGNLTVLAPESVEVAGSNLLAATTGDGNAGKLTITTGRLTVRDNAAVATLTFGDGNAGTLRIDTEQLIVRNGLLGTSTLGDPDLGLAPGKGRGGDLIVNASDSVELTNTTTSGTISLDIPIPGFNFPQLPAPIGLFSTSQSLGDSGNLTISTGRLTVRGGAEVAASTYSQGRGGNLTVNASRLVELIGTSGNAMVPSGLFTETGGSAQGGNITISTPQLFILDGAVVSVGSGKTSDLLAGRVSDNTGNGGNLTVTADLIELSGTSANPTLRSAFQAGTASLGNAGDIRIDTNRLLMRNGAVILAATLHEGNSGSITVNADSVEVTGTAPDNLPTGLTTGTAGKGAGGNLTLNTRTLTVRDGGLISAATYGPGTGGNLIVNASELVEVAGTANDGRPSGLSAGSGIKGVSSIPLLQLFGVDPLKATGDSGNLNVTTRSLIVRDGAEVSTATIGPGIGGNIQIQANSLALTNGAQLSAATSGSGRAGNISVQGADSVSLSNSSISTAVNTGAIGQGGKIDIQTRLLSLDNGAQVSAATSGQGNAGSIAVREADSVSLSNSSISSAVNAGAVGQGGNINIQTGSLSVDKGAQISASTSGQGKAGSIEVTANTLEATNGGQLLTSTASSEDAGNITLAVKDGVTLAGEGSGVFANTTLGSTGNGGSIFLNPRTVLVRDGAGIAVDSKGTGTGGNIQIQSNSITLDRQAFISAKTASNTGGDITLQAEDLLLLRRGSEISTTAGTARAGGNGGNIKIDADFIVGVPSENSDITANAFEGRGGNINITTQGIFGLEFRPRLTPLSDITASSELGINGTVQINTPGIDPNRGLGELPTDLVDATGLIDRRCAPGEGSAQTSSFTVTGRGGLPANPNETLGEEGLLEDLGSPAQVRDRERGEKQATTSASSIAPPNRLVEAQGWIIGADGKVVLTAQAPSATPQHPWQTPASCRAVSNSTEILTASPH